MVTSKSIAFRQLLCSILQLLPPFSSLVFPSVYQSCPSTSFPHGQLSATGMAAARGVKPVKPAHFVLVHGAYHGAWCWYKVRHLLESSGHNVSCVDLRSAGIDPTPVTDVRSFDDYNRPLYDLIHSNADPEAKFILVGHSFGCRSLTRLLFDPASRGKLAAVVYIAGAMLRIGSKEAADVGLNWPDGAKNVTLKPNGVPTEEFQRMLFYGTSPPEDAVLASMLLKPVPPVVAPDPGNDSSGEAVDEVRRVYVRTNRDMGWLPWQQQKMVELWPPSKIFQLDTDHCPFFSAPAELSDALVQVAADCGFS